MKRIFIVNKNSGKGVSQNDLDTIEQYFRDEPGSCEFLFTKDRDDAVNSTRSLLRDGVDQIIGVGGDGTVNAIANGFYENGKLINSDTRLAISKAGCGSDYYTSVSNKASCDSWMELVCEHVVKMVDVGRISFDDQDSEDRYFVNMASVGMIADVVVRKEKQSSLVPQTLCYVMPSLVSLFASKPIRYYIKTDKEEFEVEALTISVSKGAYAGGGMQFGLDVQLDDGLFEVTIFEKTNPVKMALKLRKMFSGNYADEEGIRKLITPWVEIKSDRPSQCEFDGDTYGTTNLRIDLLPKQIPLCCAKP